ncbi:3127_t:CDS:2 [Ambispora gerdemannii]|uniref:AP-2 complex subunit alpha n=1 Tax=Ambispora gerdemannii TaxID=144530 RepID=A0A9N8YR06_9GLOM|nr:3127_t:CDS:2 [Ambispora gerdemannii]
MSTPMRGLTVFIADIRNCRVRELEEKRINKEMANIRAKFKDGNLNGYQKKKYVCKLLYMYILGWDIDFGHMEAVHLISSHKYSEKQIGYLAVTLLMHENSDLVRLVVNSIKKDLEENNEIFNCLALHAIANIGGREMAESLATDVHRLLISPASKGFVKKKAALTLLRMYRKHPDVIPAADWAERVIQLIDDLDLGVALCVTSLIMALAQDNLEAYLGCYEKAVDRLKKLVVEKEYSLDYVYYKVPIPWLQIKLLRLLQYYPPSDDERVRAKLHDVLQAILDLSQETPKNVQHNNAQNAVLFEAINLAIHLDTESQIVNQAAVLLGRFITSKETNVRYLGLETMAHLAACVDSLEPIKKHQDTILLSLRDKDISVRRRGLDLLYSMCDVTNAKAIVAELLRYLNIADYGLREEMVLKIAILTERFATEYQWYVDIILQLISTAGDHVGEEVWYRVVQIVTNNEELQEYAARTVLIHLRSVSCHESLVKVGGYILGEFGHLIANISGASALEQFHAIHSKFGSCTLQTRALLLTTYIKFVNLFPEIKGDILSVFNQYRHVLDAELQQRAAEYLAIATMPTDDLLQTVCEEMPPFPERESALLSRLHQQHSDTEDKRTWIIGGKDVNKERESLRMSSLITRNGSSDSKKTNGHLTTHNGSTSSNGGSTSSNGNINGSNGYGDVDLLGFGDLDLNSEITESPTTMTITSQRGVLPAGCITPGSEQWFGKLVYTTEGVIYEDTQILIRLKSEYHGHMGRIALYFTNKTQIKITSFTTVIEHIENVIITTPGPPSTIPLSGQIQQLFHIECHNTFTGSPNIRVSFIAGIPVYTIGLRLPVVIAKFIEPIELNGTDFFARWKQIGGGHREAQKVFKSTYPIDVVNGGIRKLVSGFRFGILEGVDPNPSNVVGASVLHTSKSGMIGCLMRLEPNVEAQMYRLTVRTTNEIVTQELCTLLEDRLTNDKL